MRWNMILECVGEDGTESTITLGTIGRALDTIEDIEDELDLLPQDGESRKKLLKAVREFHAISKRTKTSSQIMGIATGTERRFQRPSRSPRLIKW